MSQPEGREVARRNRALTRPSRRGALQLAVRLAFRHDRLPNRALVRRLAALNQSNSSAIEDNGVDPVRLADAVGDADGDRQGVRGIIQARHLGHPEDELDHPLNLFLVGRAVADDRALDLVRGRLADRLAVLRRRQENNPTSLPNSDRGLGVAAEEQPLDGDDSRLVERQELVEQAVDCKEPLRHRQVRRCGQTAVVDCPEPAAGPFDDPVTERRCPRVDPEDDHPATSAKTSSGMSKLAVTRWTSSRSSSSSTRRSAWRALAESSSTVCLATIVFSAESTATPAPSRALRTRSRSAGDV